MKIRLTYALTCCLLLILLVVANYKIDDLEKQSKFWQDAYTSLVQYWLEQEVDWDGERNQWQDAVTSRDAIISWWGSKPPEIVEVAVDVVKEVPVDVVKEVRVIEYIDNGFTPAPFESTVAFTEWLDTWEPWMPAFGGTLYLDSSCENLAYAMMIDAGNDGYLVGTQIDPERNHMTVVVPIWSENYYLFIEPSDKTISRLFMGRVWRIN